MARLAEVSHQLLAAASEVIAGKEEVVKLAWITFLCDGHLLLEDLPGMGKTTLAKTLARLLDLEYQRVQCTADLLPADVLGAQIYNRQSEAFSFHAGPIFTQLLLADELNRASSKAQSALLEAMEERQVSVDGQSHALPTPFHVIATQNPLSQAGTYPLPESQLDRFFMRLQLGYPDAAAERSLLQARVGRAQLEDVVPIVTPSQLQDFKQAVRVVKVSDALLDYVMRLVDKTRDGSLCQLGLSPRGAVALMMAARAMALVEGRQYVVPDDVQAVFSAVVGHRIQGLKATSQPLLAQQLLDRVDVVVG